MRTSDLLQGLKGLTATGTVYAVAQLIELHEDTVRGWFKGGHFPDALAQTKIAALLDLPIEHVMAIVEHDRAHTEAARAHWQDLLRKFAACVVMGTAITTSATDARSATGPTTMETLSELPSYKLCALRLGRIRRRLTELLQFLPLGKRQMRLVGSH